MKKALLGIGALFIIGLLLLQTRFTTYNQIEESGYALPSAVLKEMLMAKPEDGFEIMELSLYRFKSLDNIYKRGSQYFLGDEKKTEIDINIPLYINDCSGLLFVNDSGVLYDTDYATAAVYSGLRISNKIAFNPGGDRADAAEYIFISMPNGMFINLDTISYYEKGTYREITPNSVIYFTEDYFTYCEPDGEQGYFQYAQYVTKNTLMNVSGEDIKYYNLLVKLGVIREVSALEKDKLTEGSGDELEDALNENIELNDNSSSEFLEGEDVLDAADTDESGDDKADNKKDKEKKQHNSGSGSKDKTNSSTERTPRQPSSNPNRGDGGGNPSDGKPAKSPERPPSADNGGVDEDPSESQPNDNDGDKNQSGGNRGVRPDYMRPDKTGESDNEGKPIDTRPVEQEYVKPEVKLISSSAKVYRLIVGLEVEDIAKRLHPNRKVQVEFYEQLSNGKERLAVRSYTSSTKEIVVGDGSIKPGTTYRTNVFFTYYNEYNDLVVESVVSDLMLTTDTFESLGSINLDDIDLKIYYDDHLTLPHVIAAESSDFEAVYGIKTVGGITMNIAGRGLQALDIIEPTVLDGATTKSFKNNAGPNFNSLMNLKPNSEYKYELEFVDFFGNKLQVTNNKGEFVTCKAKPTASIELEDNVIRNISFNVKYSDKDLSAVKNSEGKYDIYFVLATDAHTTYNPITLDEIKNGSDRVNVADVYNMSECVDYTNVDENGNVILNIDILHVRDNLKLNQRYYAYIFCDYDLNNGAGLVEFAKIAEYSFISASLTSLGKVYVDVAVNHITAHTAVITYKLNTRKTDETLHKLLTEVSFVVKPSNGAEIDESITYPELSFGATNNPVAMEEFTGYDFGPGSDFGIDANDPDLDQAVGNNVIMDASYFNYIEIDGEYIYPIKSMTDCLITPTIIASYEGLTEEMEVVLTTDSFKTLREPARVIVKNVLMAASNLIFDVKVEDPDDSITGVTGHKVNMYLYQADGSLVDALRIEKNKDDFEHIIIGNVNTDRQHKLVFTAQEYNEGYTNATYESNKIIYEYMITDIIRLSGEIKLMQLSNSITGKLDADVRIRFRDLDRMLLDMPYYIKVEKFDKNMNLLEDSSVTTEISGKTPGGYPANGSHTVLVDDYDREDEAALEYSKVYRTDKGSYNYTLTLYVIINNQELVIDTLTFDTEDKIIKLSSAEDLIWKIYHDYENGEYNNRYIATNDIEIITSNKTGEGEYYEFPAAAEGEKGRMLRAYNFLGETANRNGDKFSYFSGRIDFQGYKLRNDARVASPRLFNRLSSSGEIRNMVFELSAKNTSTRFTYSGGLVMFNFGSIHDIQINYMGGSALNHYCFGVLSRYNCMGGVVENFVCGNIPEDEMMGLSGDSWVGFVCRQNFGTIRNGYAYGTTDIYMDTISNPGASKQMLAGAITGKNTSNAVIENVYSLLNVTTIDCNKMASTPLYYGSICGLNEGRVRNCYSIGENKFPKEYQGNLVNTSVMTGCGNNSANRKCENIYYYNESNRIYRNDENEKRVGASTLYDSGWQTAVLGNQFNTSLAEVGYYPQVKMSAVMPSQPYLKLPARDLKNKTIDIMSSSFIEYTNAEETAARVSFRFYNPQVVAITNIEIEYIGNVEILQETAKSEDGYTYVEAIVSNPQKFRSAYSIQNASYLGEKGTLKQNFDPQPELLVDFYRVITTTKEWEMLTGSKAELRDAKNTSNIYENIRLGADLDFAGINEAKIKVVLNYYGKIDGAGHLMKNISIPGKDSTAEGYLSLFRYFRESAEMKNIYFENLKMGDKDWISQAQKNARLHPSLIWYHFGILEDVHITNMELYGYGMCAPIGRAEANSKLKNCTVNNIIVEYLEAPNKTNDGYLGGLVAYASYAEIENSFVRNLNISAMDIANCVGAGGVVGYMNQGRIDGVYATGDIEVRGNNVGGVSGKYICSAYYSRYANALSRVNVTTYTDFIGGITGVAQCTDMFSAKNNMSAVAFGDVYCVNPDSENVAYAIGTYTNDVRPAFYGSDFQMYNGWYKASDNLTPDRYMLTEAECLTASTYTATDKVSMDTCFDFSLVEDVDSNGEPDPHFPVLYYQGTFIPLPGQEDKIPLTEALAIKNDPIRVKKVVCNTTSKIITVTVEEDTELKIDDINVDYLRLEKVADASYASGYKVDVKDWLYDPTSKTATFKLFYDDSAVDFSLNHWLDSYTMRGVTYIDASGNKQNLTFAKPTQIPLTLYCEIVEDTKFVQAMMEKDGGSYENYLITKNIDFTNIRPETNLKIGRLIGRRGSDIKLSNLNITGANNDFIYKVLSEVGYLTFENCTVNTTGRNYSGLIGTNFGTMHDVTFNNIDVQSNTSSFGVLGRQVGGKIKDVKVTNVLVNNSNKALDNIGGFVGYITSYPKIIRLYGEKISVKGRTNIGGLIGYASNANIKDIDKSTESHGTPSIEGKDIQIAAVGQRVGGLIGYLDNANSASFKTYGLKLSGTLTKDASTGDITDSTTKIVCTIPSSSTSITTAQVGGLIGRQNGTYCGYISGVSSDRNSAYVYNVVDGIVIQSNKGETGGAYGYTYYTSNTKVSNSLITDGGAAFAGTGSIGGIVGRATGETYCSDAENIIIDVVNTNNIGGAVGYNSHHIYYTNVVNSLVKASSNNGTTYSAVGGISGRSTNQIHYCITKNVSVEASDLNYVGGIAGHATANISRVNNYYDPVDINNDPASKDIYRIAGRNYVGGLVGYHSSGETYYSQSNGNVVATEKGAGGFDGYYNNKYTKANGAYSYSGVKVYRSMFTGTVQAEKNAGGAFGIVGMNELDASIESAADRKEALAIHKQRGGRCSDTTFAKYKSGSSNEEAYTFGNMIFAKSVIAVSSDAYAMAGSMDGFEGKANYWNVAAKYQTASNKVLANSNFDKSDKDHPKYTYFWEGMVVGTTGSSKALYYWEASEAPAWAKNMFASRPEYMRLAKNQHYKNYTSITTGETKRYLAWENNGYSGTSTIWPDLNENYFDYRKSHTNVRLVSSVDRKQKVNSAYDASDWYPSNGTPSATYPYKEQNDFLSYSMWASADLGTVENANYKRNPRGYCKLFFFDTAYGRQYASTAGMPSDTKNQIDKLVNEHGLKYYGYKWLPILRTNTGNENLSTDVFLCKEIDLELYLPIPSHTDWLTSGRSMATASDETEGTVSVYPVDADKINVEFSENFVDSNGSFTIYLGNEEIETVDIERRVYTYSYDYSDSITVVSSFSPGVINSVIYYEPSDLKRRVMTYGNDYYYISDSLITADVSKHGIVFGAGTSVSGESNNFVPGEFITLYRGNALDEAGNVIDAKTGTVKRTVRGLTRLNYVVPFISQTVSFIQNSTSVTVNTFNRFSDSELVAGLGAGDVQFFGAQDGTISIIDSAILNKKESYVIYSKDDTPHNTVLMNEGYITDLNLGSEAIGAPESFDNSRIKFMTNNLECSQPFILVEYDNGDIVGFNYLTGEYLFSASDYNRVVSLEDYVRKTIEGYDKDPSNRGFAENQRVIAMTRNPESLANYVKGNSSKNVEGNSDGLNVGETGEFTVASDNVGGDLGELAKGDDPDGITGAGDKKPADGNGVANPNAAGTDNPDGADNDQLSSALNGTQGGNAQNSGTNNEIYGNSMNASGNTDEGANGMGLSEGEVNADTYDKAGFDSDSGMYSDYETDFITDGEGDASTDGVEGIEKINNASSNIGGIADHTVGALENNISSETNSNSGKEKGNGKKPSGTLVDEGEVEDTIDNLIEREIIEVTEDDNKGKSDSLESTVAGIKVDDEKEKTEESLIPQNGIDTGIKSQYTAVDNSSAETDEVTVEVSNHTSIANGRLITVFNAATGTYEIIDALQFLINEGYQSENLRLQVKDFATFSDIDYAAAEQVAEKSMINGIWLYLAVALSMIAGLCIIWALYRKNRRIIK